MNAHEQTRLFIALWPDDVIRHHLADYRNAWRWQERPARVRDDKLHITLHFLGNVPRASLPELRMALAVPCAAFDLVLGHPVLLPRGVAVIEPLAVPDELRTLHSTLKEVLRGLGLPVESRPFRPHVTLARRARQAGFPEQALKIIWRVESYALVASELASGEYRVLAKYPADG